MRYHLVLLLCLAFIAPSRARAAEAPDKPILLADCLVLPSVGSGGREPLHTDPVESALVAGTWKAPRPEEKVEGPAGRVSTWQKASADKNGSLAHFALFGGYLHWRVARKSAGLMLLEASGHVFVYVNGELRPGDPYSHGFVRVPVQLRAGDNDLLFLGARGRIAARLTPPASSVLLHTGDLTLPDLIAGEKGPVWGAVVVINASAKPIDNFALEVVPDGGEPRSTPLPVLQPLSVRKVRFLIAATARKAGESVALELRLRSRGADRALHTAKVAVSVRGPTQMHKRTFVSDIDGSVQYYAVVPARPKAGEKTAPGLVLTLHGAAVEATGQAGCYAAKPFAHIVAPTNRRSFGFDWEDWGRLDALEVLGLASKSLRTDPRRTYLTGHSMGGHGTWHLGATFPDRWAAIAPSAGWISFATYAGAKPPAKPTPLQEILLRPASPSNTPALVRNYAMHGVYVLHGDVDETVPVQEARTMRKILGGFHPDFAYYERRGARHWWGNACVDWPPISEFFAARARPRREDVRQVDFVTASPGVSAWCHWAGIEAQEKAMQPSEVHLRLDPKRGTFSGTTRNVARLALDLVALDPGAPIDVKLDGQKLDRLPWPDKGGRLWLKREDGKWSAMAEPAPALKGPRRYGPFKEAFRNRVLFVYGTKGTAAENAWSFAKARYDAETFWYRGNASVDVMADSAFDARREPDRNVVLYGHAQSNSAWVALLGAGPVQVKRGAVRVGTRTEKGDLACLFIRPRPGSDRAVVAAVSGSGLAGMRLTDRLPVFTSGIGYPDCLVMAPDVLTRGLAGVRGAGFFGVDWGVSSGEWVWRKAE
jgi:pimeloyl-ACP methyl ester carboxylesterase